PVAAMLRLAPVRLPPKFAAAGRRLFPASAPRRGRVALLTGCVSPVVAPAINAAAIRLLTRHGIEVVVADEGCCGSLAHHMGRESEALSAARSMPGPPRSRARASTPSWSRPQVAAP